MRIITDSDGRVLDVSFGALISCGGQDGTDYTGTVPTGYTSLEDWFIKEADKLYRWTVVDGELTLDSSAVAPTDKLPAADYVVEQGTSGIWTYEKWNSGIAECWGESEHTITHYATLNGFYGYYVDIALPFTFAAVPIKTFTPQVGSGFSIPAGNMADSTTKVRLYILSNVSGTNTVKATIYVKGRWK